MSRKPTSPAACWVFPAKGPPRLEWADLPATTEAIEALVVDRFAQRLSDDGHDIEVLPRPSDEWPDGLARVDGRSVGLELVEVVDGQHRQKVQGQRWYLAEIMQSFSRHGVASSLAGMKLELFDMYKGLPPARSPQARQLVESIAAQMADRHLKAFATTPLGACQFADFNVPPRQIRLVAERVTNDVADYLLRWNGAYLVDHMCLKRAVEKKVDQRYAGRAGQDQMWLVAWDSFGYLMNSAKQAARGTLDACPRAFDAVWTCALAAPRLTLVEQLWPYDAADAVEDNLNETISFSSGSWLQ